MAAKSLESPRTLCRFAFLCLVALALSLVSYRSHALDAPVRVVTLEQEVRARGDYLTVSIVNGPAPVAHAVIHLERNGHLYVLPAEYAAATSSNSVATATAQLSLATENAPLPLGKYKVSALLDDKAFVAAHLLEIAPLGDPELHLKEFVPASTDERHHAFFDDARVGDHAHATDVVSLVLRGSGFQTGDQAQENAIFINNARQNVTWAKCEGAPYGSEAAPVRRQIIGEAVSDEEIHLCLVPVPPLGEMLVAVGRGDRLSERQSFRAFSMGRTPVGLIAALIATLLALLPLALLRRVNRPYAIGLGQYKLRLLFLDPETDTYSLSNLQFYLWTVVALFAYTYLFVSRVVVQHALWPDVPAALPGIVAVAAGTSIGSRLITSSKGSKGAGAVEPSVADYITAGGVVAPDRVQMLLWTLFGVGAFAFTVMDQHPGTITDLPAIPERLLYLTGISAAGYLGGKMARKPGPVINEISVEPADADDFIVGAAAPSPNEMPDLTLAITEARSRQAALPAPTNANAAAAITALSNAISRASTVQTAADIEKLVSDLSVWRATAHEQATLAAEGFANATDTAARQSAAADAAIAQQAAAILQDLAADITRAISVATAGPMLAATAPPMITRTITLRGTNLSAEAMLEVDHEDLTFHMLLNSAGKQEPDVLVRENDTPTFARVLRFTIEPARLEATELAKFGKWFGSRGNRTFTLTNPDGQKAELMFSLPPGEVQKANTAS